MAYVGTRLGLTVTCRTTIAPCLVTVVDTVAAVVVRVTVRVLRRGRAL